MLLPTNQQVTDALEVFTYQPSEGASEDPQSPPSPQTVLEKYFGTNNTSPTQLLYNLEVNNTVNMKVHFTTDQIHSLIEWGL